MNQAIKHTLRKATAPFFLYAPIRKWTPLAGRIQDLSIPRGVIPNPKPEPCGAANINILLDLIDRVEGIKCPIAECGVFRGCTLVSMALYLWQTRSTKVVYGFDSFKGFGDVIQHDMQMSNGHIDPNMRSNGFSDTSRELVERKLRLFGLTKDVHLIPGFFETSLAKCPEKLFSYVHLDCDAYDSYRTCLKHFYPRMAKGGIISLDEYNDPPWPGCNKAVDEFLLDKPEKLEEITRDNHIKYYFAKQ